MVERDGTRCHVVLRSYLVLGGFSRGDILCPVQWLLVMTMAAHTLGSEISPMACNAG